MMKEVRAPSLSPRSVTLLTGKEEPSSASPAHSSSGSRADKQAVRSSLFTDAHAIFLLESSMESCVRTLPLTSVSHFDQRVTSVLIKKVRSVVDGEYCCRI